MNKRTETKLRNAAKRGAKKLDSVLPKWFTRRYITISDLDLSRCSTCIVGQLGFKVDMSGEPLRSILSQAYDPKYGFDSLVGDEGYDILTDEWKKQIRERRKAPVAA